MTTEAQVRAAKGPPDALLAIAKALDRIEAKLDAGAVDDGWGEWDRDKADSHEFAKAFTVSGSEDAPVVDIKRVDEEREAQRREFAVSTLLIEEVWPGIGATEAYVLGGPTWLYEFDRGHVMQLPAGIKRMLVDDLLQDDPQAALDMGKDILRAESDGPPSTGGEWV